MFKKIKNKKLRVTYNVYPSKRADTKSHNLLTYIS